MLICSRCWSDYFLLCVGLGESVPAILAAAYESNAVVLFQFLTYPSRHDLTVCAENQTWAVSRIRRNAAFMRQRARVIECAAGFIPIGAVETRTG
jgi:hypothetical protein